MSRQLTSQKILVTGAYGLVGSAITRRLIADGHHVTGFGRNCHHARTVFPDLDWVIGDFADQQSIDTWRDVLNGFDAVVNCVGALQDGASDNLAKVHHHAVAALAAACRETRCRLVQISATGASLDASTGFFRTKAAGDAAIIASGAQYWIFRPGLVIAPDAYGGTLLLRMLAATPVFQPIAMPGSDIQTVSIDDVADATALAISGNVPPCSCFDLVEAGQQDLQTIVLKHRHWLGFAPAKRSIVAPPWMLAATSAIADLLGKFGWRSPLRSTAIAVLRDGVTGNPDPWRAVTGKDLSSLHQTLATFPATAEHRLSARTALLMPLVIATLFVFWLSSGVIGLANLSDAATVLETAGWTHRQAQAGVLFWSLIDIIIASALLVRRLAPVACWAMIGVSLIYLLAASWFTPHLWSDPIGPLVKILPAMILALVGRVMLEAR